MLDRLDCAALGFYDTGNSPRFVRGQLTRRHRPSYCPERVSHISRRLDCRQFEYDRPALAEWHKPLETKPHGRRIAAFRRSDHGPNDGVPIVVKKFLGKLLDARAGAFRLPARVPGHALLETSSLILS
jgi:hypothetical protein